MIVLKKNYESMMHAYEEALTDAEQERDINAERVVQLQEELREAQAVTARRVAVSQAVRKARKDAEAAQEEQAKVERVFKEAIIKKWVEFRLSDQDTRRTTIVES